MTVLIASSGNAITTATAITPTQAFQTVSSSSTTGGECLIMRSHKWTMILPQHLTVQMRPARIGLSVVDKNQAIVIDQAWVLQ